MNTGQTQIATSEACIASITAFGIFFVSYLCALAPLREIFRFFFAFFATNSLVCESAPRRRGAWAAW